MLYWHRHTHILFFCSMAMSGGLYSATGPLVPATLGAPYQADMMWSWFSRDVYSSVSMVQKAVSKELSVFIPFDDVIKPRFGN